MKAALLAVLGAAVLSTGVASASFQASPTRDGMNFGYAEDATKYADDGGDKLFGLMNGQGTTTNRVAVFWNADAPTTIQDQSFLDRMIPVARKHDVQVVFAIYPLRATQAPTSAGAVEQFCNYAVLVMQRYTYVRKVILGNEPNQPRFWQPIWNGNEPASPAAMAAVLASCYDKLKAFDANIDVVGVGLSPRGNDNPGASSNSSISPVRWIAALGKAYKAMGRSKPLFDSWSWHCYPNVNTDEVETGYDWPNTGCVNAARVKLALWDAFHGTAQPVLAGYPIDTSGTTLFGRVAKMFVDETGWQVDTQGRAGYTNAENVPTISEAKQNEDYKKLVDIAKCESTLTDFHIFHQVDESDRTGFQSGPLRVDQSQRDAWAGIQSELPGSCAGAPWSTLGSFLYSNSAVTPEYDGFPYTSPQPLAEKKVQGGGIYVQMGAGEAFDYTVTFQPGGSKVSSAESVEQKAIKAPTGSTSATVVLKAETNPQRTSTVTVQLGAGASDGGTGTVPKCKKGQKSTKKKPCRK